MGMKMKKLKLMRKVKKRLSMQSIHAVQASHSKSAETKFYCHQEYKMLCLSPQTKGKPRDVWVLPSQEKWVDSVNRHWIYPTLFSPFRVWCVSVWIHFLWIKGVNDCECVFLPWILVLKLFSSSTSFFARRLTCRWFRSGVRRLFVSTAFRGNSTVSTNVQVLSDWEERERDDDRVLSNERQQLVLSFLSCLLPSDRFIVLSCRVVPSIVSVLVALLSTSPSQWSID